jgi:hypothetical protein
MVVSKNGEKVAKVKYGEEEVECVYLGTIFSSNGKWEPDIERRRQTERATLCSLNKQVVWNWNVPIRVKRTASKAMVKSKLLYGGVIWWGEKKDTGKLETAQNDFIHWI